MKLILQINRGVSKFSYFDLMLITFLQNTYQEYFRGSHKSNLFDHFNKANNAKQNEALCNFFIIFKFTFSYSYQHRCMYLNSYFYAITQTSITAKTEFNGKNFHGKMNKLLFTMSNCFKQSVCANVFTSLKKVLNPFSLTDSCL